MFHALLAFVVNIVFAVILRCVHLYILIINIT